MSHFRRPKASPAPILTPHSISYADLITFLAYAYVVIDEPAQPTTFVGTWLLARRLSMRKMPEQIEVLATAESNRTARPAVSSRGIV